MKKKKKKVSIQFLQGEIKRLNFELDESEIKRSDAVANVRELKVRDEETRRQIATALGKFADMGPMHFNRESERVPTWFQLAFEIGRLKEAERGLDVSKDLRDFDKRIDWLSERVDDMGKDPEQPVREKV